MGTDAAGGLQGLTYRSLILGLKRAGSPHGRKELADRAVTRPDAFELVLGQAKAALA